MITCRGRHINWLLYHLIASSIAACGRLGVFCFAVVPYSSSSSSSPPPPLTSPQNKLNGGISSSLPPIRTSSSLTASLDSRQEEQQQRQDDELTTHNNNNNNNDGSLPLDPTNGNKLPDDVVTNNNGESSAVTEAPAQPHVMVVTPAGATSSSSTKTLSRWPQFDELDRRISKIAIPCIANFAINPLIGAVDLFWVGRMGNALAIAGQAAANQVFNSAFWLISYLPSVTATLVSKEYAKQDQDGVQDAICQAFFVGISLALFGTLFLLLKPDLVLRSVLSADAPALQFAKPYLLIRAFAFLPALTSNIGYSAFRGILDTVTPLKISLSANLFNAIFDPLLIFTAGMGVTGAALATLTAELASSVIYMRTMLRRKLIRWSKLFKIPKWSTLAPLLKGGAALQLRNLALNIAFLSVARVTQGIDQSGVAAAAHSIAIQVFQVGGIVLLALSTVAQTLVPNEMVVKHDATTGESVGGVRDAKVTVNRLMSWGLVLGAGLGALQIALIPMLHKFTPLKEVQEAALMPSYLASVLQIINGLVFIGEGVMIGCGNFLQLGFSTVVATIGLLTALKVFPPVFGLTGVWMGFGVFNVLRLFGVMLHQMRTGPLAERNIAKLGL